MQAKVKTMATTISVNKQSVLELLQTGRTKPFVIPEYQRPYAWEAEQIETLFEDLWDFTVSIGGPEREGASYFLGSIVSFESTQENGAVAQEIIDGQQRLTSLFLLLRAIYTKLKNSDDVQEKKAANFIAKIEPCIWTTDKLTGEVNYNDILLTSEVVDNEGNEVLRRILETGIVDSKATDNYSKNYRLFQKLYDEHCQQSPINIYNFIYAILNQAILLPISADSRDTALTIFSTLNNRGLPLSDADIFKAKIYNNLNLEEKACFIAQWKKLEKESADAGESIQQLFYYYMFYLRALEGDANTTTPGIRKYYSANKFARLYAPNLMDNLSILLNLWKVINTNQEIVGETWDNNKEIRKTLDILNAFPNEWWKYPVITYYLHYRDLADFDKLFLVFLRKLAADILTRYLIMPSINSVKNDIPKLSTRVIKSPHPDFELRQLDKSSLDERIKVPHPYLVKMLLKVYAYEHQDALLPDKWQIEHILPQKWHTSFFPNVDEETVNIMVEHIGNKTPFEKRLNIQASNGYFKIKQEKYMESKIEVTHSLTLPATEDWTLSHIAHRDEVVSTDILNAINRWAEEYVAETPVTNKPQPTPEQLAQIEELRRLGLI